MLQNMRLGFYLFQLLKYLYGYSCKIYDVASLHDIRIYSFESTLTESVRGSASQKILPPDKDVLFNSWQVYATS